MLGLKRITIGNSALTASEISLGCMRMADLSKEDANKVINTALENGIDFLITRIFMAAVNQRKSLLMRLI